MEIHTPTANPFPRAPTLPTTSSIHHHCVYKKEMTATCSLQPFQTCVEIIIKTALKQI